MSGLKKIIKKAQALSADEIFVRSTQTLQSLRERRGLSVLSRLPSDEAFEALLYSNQLSKDFRLTKQGGFFSGFLDREQTASALRKRWEGFSRDVIDTANEISKGRFRLFGFQNLSFGNPIDWHFNPISGQRSPLVHWSSLNNLDTHETGDRKIVWELNRHQYFSILGQAYWLTGDERFAETFVTHITGWMDQNPPKVGINWSSSLEIAFRSISWLWAFQFFRDSPAVTAEVVVRALKFLYLNARHLETFLSTYYSPNTHLTGEGLGLFYLGHMLPEFREASRWKDAGEAILLRELDRHVQPDGVYFEQTTYYHRYTTDFYLHYFVLSLAERKAVSPNVKEKLVSLLDHLMYLTRPDGTTPLIGDDDGGRLISVNLKPANDFRACLSTAAALFERPDYKFVARNVDIETLWLLGPSGLSDYDSLATHEPEKLSQSFEAGGYYVMRDSWDETANYLVVDCGPHGTLNCGHAHADALSIDVAVSGKTSVVDPGTYTYTGDSGLRDWFRGTSAHNTLTLRQLSSSEPDGPFAWKHIAKSTRRSWLSHESFDFFKGDQNGYLRLSNPAVHQRAIFFLKKNYWIIQDQLTVPKAEPADIWFHFAPFIEPRLSKSPAGDDVFVDSTVELHSFAENGSWRQEDGWVSNCYLKRDPAKVCVFSAVLGESRSAVTFMLPVSGSWKVQQLTAIGGKAFAIVNDSWRDLVMIRTGERVEAEGFSTDFQWSLVRSEVGRDDLEKLVLIGGHSLQMGDRVVVKRTDQEEYVVADRSEIEKLVV